MATVFPGLGLTISRFLDELSDVDVRRFLDHRILRVLDAIFGGRIGGGELRRVAKNLTDFSRVLEDVDGRKLVLELIPQEKRPELRDRVGRDIEPYNAGLWDEQEVRRLKEFFDVEDERLAQPTISSATTISPGYGLFDHQRVAVRTLIPLLTEDERRAVLHLPTGVGKTRTAMHVVAHFLRENDPSLVVWLASGKELLEQAAHAFQEAWEHLGTRRLQLGAMWGDLTPDLDNFEDGFLAVGLAKGWALMSRTDPDWAARLSARTSLVVFDEAHQSIAQTYRRITDDLTLSHRCALLGLTATPGRTWADIDKDGELAAFFGGQKVSLDVPGDNPIEYLTANGFLARPVFRTLFAEPGIHMDQGELIRISNLLEIPEDIVEELSLSEQYVTAVVGAITELLNKGHKRILVFSATVAHAELLTAILVARNVHSSALTASTAARDRDRAIRAFKADDNEQRVLVNFGVLTTGFDAPKASAVVIARPTMSLVLYSQMVGRAIRGPRAGGTETCEIVTVVDPGLPGFGDIADAFLNWEDVWQ